MIGGLAVGLFRLEKLWREEVCNEGLENASMSRVIMRFMRSRTVVACVVVTLSVALVLFSVVSIRCTSQLELGEMISSVTWWLHVTLRLAIDHPSLFGEPVGLWYHPLWY